MTSSISKNVRWIDEKKCIRIKDIMTYWILSLFGISASSSAPSFFFLNLTLRIVNLRARLKLIGKMKRIYEPFVPLCPAETAPGRERVGQATVRVEEEEDVGVDRGVRHD